MNIDGVFTHAVYTRSLSKSAPEQQTEVVPHRKSVCLGFYFSQTVYCINNF